MRDEGQILLGWRDVPTDAGVLGESVRTTEPVSRQAFIAQGPAGGDQDAFERRLFILRKVISNAVYDLADPRTAGYYPVSLSSRTVVYKGLFLAGALGRYYPDLVDLRFESALALVHQRFSTNTFPTWSRSHPYRMVAHNGEINTLRGNVNWMAARQASVDSELFGADITKLWPVSYEGTVGHRLFRQRARVSPAGRLLAAARDDDAHPRGLVRQSADGREPARLLRISCGVDGALGRSGRRLLHGRPTDRRDARP